MKSARIKGLFCSLLAVLLVGVTVFPCFAEAGTVSAVDEKAAPSVVFAGSSDDAMTRIEGEDMERLPLTPEDLEVRSYAERRNPDALLSVSDELMYAYRTLNSVSSLGELEQQLDAKAQEIDESYSAAAFVVSDLFAVSLSDEMAAVLRSGKERCLYLTVRYDTEAAGHRPVVIRQNSSDQSWSLADVDEESGDGVVSVRLPESGVLAILVTDGERMQHRDVTGNEKYIWIAVFAILLAIFAAVTLFVVFYRRGRTVTGGARGGHGTDDAVDGGT